MSYLYYKAINWNETEDEVDQTTWEKYTSHFWLDTRVPISEDEGIWQKMPENDQKRFQAVIGRLALLATLQSEYGLPKIRSGIRSQQEEAILNNMTFMTSVHAKSYSTILMTLGYSSQGIERLFTEIESNEGLDRLIDLLQTTYKEGNDLQKRVAAISIQSFLTYSALFAILQFESQGKLLNTAKLLRLIMRDNDAYSSYLSYKFKLSFAELDANEQVSLKKWLKTFTKTCLQYVLADAEKVYQNDSDLSNVKTFILYGVCHHFAKMGLEFNGDDFIKLVTWEDLPPFIRKGLSNPSEEVAFSQEVISVQARNEEMTDDDYDF